MDVAGRGGLGTTLQEQSLASNPAASVARSAELSWRALFQSLNMIYSATRCGSDVPHRRRGSIDGLRPMRILSPRLQRARVMSFISRANFCKAVAVCVAVVAGRSVPRAPEGRGAGNHAAGRAPRHAA